MSRKYNPVALRKSYPVMSEFTDDYKSNAIAWDGIGFEIVDGGRRLRITVPESVMKVNGDEAIAGLLSEGKARFVLQVECLSTNWRDCFNMNEAIDIEMKKLNSEVTFLPALVATEDLQLKDSNLNDRYGGTSFIEEGGFIAMGDLLKKEIIKPLPDDDSSFFQFKENKNGDFIEIDDDDPDVVVISLPKEINDDLHNMQTVNERNSYTAMYVPAALTYLIDKYWKRKDQEPGEKWGAAINGRIEELRKSGYDVEGATSFDLAYRILRNVMADESHYLYGKFYKED